MTLRIEHRAFSMSYDRLIYDLIAPVKILPLLSQPPRSNTVATNALWDTGSQITCIKPGMSNKLSLRSYGADDHITLSGIGGSTTASITVINLFLTPNFVIESCPVYVIDFPGNADVLIGMDIISMGDFVVCNADGKTSFSFAVPPFADRINLADKADAVNNSRN